MDIIQKYDAFLFGLFLEGLKQKFQQENGRSRASKLTQGGFKGEKTDVTSSSNLTSNLKPL